MSKYKINGVVDKAYSKVKNTRVGDKTIHYAEVDGVEFSTGFKSIFSQGEMINIVVEWKYGEYQIVAGTAPTNEPAAVAGGPPKSAGGAGKKPWGGKAASKFPVEPTDGQMSIIRQNSMNRAVEILEVWINNGIFTPKTEDDYMKKLHEVALTITDFNSGQDIMKMAAAQAAQLQAVGQ